MTDDDLIDALKAIGHPLRMTILSALRDRERNVGEIEAATAIGQPALSQQLAVLRKAGLVDTRKDAKLVYYRLAESRFAALADVMGDLARHSQIAKPQRRAPSPGAANFARLG